MPLTIRRATYRGIDGYSIRGTITLASGHQSPRVNIFAKTREGAEAIREAVKAGNDGAVSQILLKGR